MLTWGHMRDLMLTVSFDRLNVIRLYLDIHTRLEYGDILNFDHSDLEK
jgi:hypothetical protein